MRLLPLLCLFLAAPTFAQQPLATQRKAGWPAVFDAFTVLDLHLDMAPADWNTIQNDDTLSIEVPALFWTGSELPILVAVRRKSATPLSALRSPLSALRSPLFIRPATHPHPC